MYWRPVKLAAAARPRVRHEGPWDNTSIFSNFDMSAAMESKLRTKKKSPRVHTPKVLFDALSAGSPFARCMPKGTAAVAATCSFSVAKEGNPRIRNQAVMETPEMIEKII